MPVGKVKKISKDIDRRSKSSWIGVHEFFNQGSMMQEHRKQPTKQAQRQKTVGIAPVHVLNLNEEALM
jgi:hypothetical protein